MLNSPQKRWDCKRVCSNTRGVNCTVCWSYGDIWTINMYIYIYILSIFPSLISFWTPNVISTSLNGNQDLFPHFLKLLPECCNICTINKMVNQSINFCMTVLTHIRDLTIPNRECIITRKESIYNFVLKSLHIWFNTYFKWQTKDWFSFMFANIIYLGPFCNNCRLFLNFADCWQLISIIYNFFLIFIGNTSHSYMTNNVQPTSSLCVLIMSYSKFFANNITCSLLCCALKDYSYV